MLKTTFTTAPLVALLVALIAVALWLPVAILRALMPDHWEPSFVRDFTLTQTLSPVALVAFNVLQILRSNGELFASVPGLREQPFLKALEVCSPEKAAELCSRPSLRTIRSQVLSLLGALLLYVFLGTAGIAATVLAGPGILTLLASGASLALLALTPVGAIALVIGIVLALLVCGGIGMIAAPVLSAIGAIKKIFVSVPSSVVIALGICLGVVQGPLLAHLLTVAYAITGAHLMAIQMISRFTITVSAEEEIGYTEARRWALVGLGIPAWALVYMYPFAALLLLDLTQTVGAAFHCNEATCDDKER